jgi:ABC-type antimicrobial peptide transport system permease subunit
MKRAGTLAYFGGIASSVFLAACCLGMLALLGITTFVVTLGAWQLELVSDAVLFPALGVSLVVTLGGYYMRRRARRA